MTDGTPSSAYPATALQKAIYETLSTSPRLRALFGGEAPNVWDSVKRDANGRPVGGTTYFKIGEDQIIQPEQTADVAESEAYTTIKFFDEPGDGSGKELSKLVLGVTCDELVGSGFDDFADRLLAHGFVCTLGEIREARHLEPADGLTEQAVLTIRWELDPVPDL